MIEAKSGTELRALALMALVDEGETLPKYNLWDQPATISVPRAGRIIVDFWSKHAVIDKRNQYYKLLLKAIEGA